MPVAPNSSFPIPVAVDLDFRPDTYVADWCALAALVQHVTGEARRAEVYRAGFGSARWHGDQLIDVPPRPLTARLLADRLSPAERKRYVAGDPVERVSGEYLPPYLPGELEIARLVLATRPMLVYSVRARSVRSVGVSPFTSRTFAELRHVRIVDEHGTTFTVPMNETQGTFTLRDLIRCIDGVRASHLSEHPPELPFPEAILREARALGVPAGELHDFVHVSSVVYPELRPFYRHRLAWWVQQHFETGPRSRYSRFSWADTVARWWKERG